MDIALDQEAIDAMFASARGPGAKDAAARPAESADKVSRRDVYNFRRAGQISSEQMKTVGTANDSFARNLTHNLGAWLRTNFLATLCSTEQMVYSEFVDRIPEVMYVCSARLEPLDALGVLQFDLTLAPPIVDLLLGGVGRPGPLREPTEIEEAILLSVMDLLIRDLNVAWQQVGLKFALGKREQAAQIARVMPAGEKTVCVGFEIRMPQAQGTLNLCLPAAVLNTILRRMMWEERDRPRRRSAEARARMGDLMAEAKFGAMLQFAPMRLNARELADLAPGKLLRLPLPKHAPAELRVGGLPIFRAQPVRSGEHRGGQMSGHSPAAERPVS